MPKKPLTKKEFVQKLFRGELTDLMSDTEDLGIDEEKDVKIGIMPGPKNGMPGSPEDMWKDMFKGQIHRVDPLVRDAGAWALGQKKPIEQAREQSPAGADRQKPKFDVVKAARKATSLSDNRDIFDKAAEYLGGEENMWGKGKGGKILELWDQLTNPTYGNEKRGVELKKFGIDDPDALKMGTMPGLPGKNLIKGAVDKVDDLASRVAKDRRLVDKPLPGGITERRMGELKLGPQNPKVEKEVPDERYQELLDKLGGIQGKQIDVPPAKKPHPLYKGPGVEPKPRSEKGLGGVQSQIEIKKFPDVPEDKTIASIEEFVKKPHPSTVAKPKVHPMYKGPGVEPSERSLGRGVQTQIEAKTGLGPEPMKPIKAVQPQLTGMPTKVAKVKEETSKVPALLQAVQNAGLKIYDKPAKDIKEAISRFPKEKELIKLYQKGKGGEDFYTEFKPTIERYLGKENVDTFIDYLASTSPANQLRANIEMAVRAMEQAKSGKEFTGFMKAHSMNLDRAKQGLPLSGPKVQKFQQNLKTGKDAEDKGVTVDRWMVGIYGGDPMGAPSKELYAAIEKNVQKIAKKLGVSPKDFQAGLWAGARGKKESISSIMEDSFGQRDLFQPDVLSPKIAARAQQLSMKDSVNEIAKLSTPSQVGESAGATYNLYKGNLAGTPHFAVAVFPDRTRILKGAPSPKDIASYIQKNRDVIDNPEFSVGTWYDSTKDEFVLDVVKTVTDRNHAVQLGQRYNQDAIFDLGKLEEIRLR